MPWDNERRARPEVVGRAGQLLPYASRGHGHAVTAKPETRNVIDWERVIATWQCDPRRRVAADERMAHRAKGAASRAIIPRPKRKSAKFGTRCRLAPWGSVRWSGS